MASKQVYKNANGVNAEVTLVNPDTNFNKRTVELNSIMDKTPTIATLRAKTEIPETIYVTGYHSEGDGAFGSHFFKWNDSSTEDDNGGTIIKLDSVATGRYELQYDGAVNVKWFGAKGDGITDDTTAIQSAMDSGKSSIYVPFGTYIISSTITTPASKFGFTIFSESIYTKLQAIGSIIMLETFSSYTNIENISIYGELDGSVFWTTGSVAIKTSSNLTMTNVNIRQWDEIIKWNGGYYHKYYNCQFTNSNYISKGMTANNFTVLGSRVSKINYGFLLNGGTGDFIFDKGSVEKVTETFVSQVSGAGTAITISDSYFENYPDIDETTNGMTKPYNELVIATLGKGDISFRNNNISTKGVRRLISALGTDGENKVNISTTENKIVVNNGVYNDLEYCYVLNGEIGNASFYDSIVFSSIGGVGSYTTEFINNVGNPDKIIGNNPITGKALQEEWINADLLNGWTNDGGTSQYDLQYFKDFYDFVYIRGRIDGASSTSVVCTNLPEGYRPEGYEYFNAITSSGDVVTCRVSTSGDIRIELPSTPINVSISFMFKAYQ